MLLPQGRICAEVPATVYPAAKTPASGAPAAAVTATIILPGQKISADCTAKFDVCSPNASHP